MTQNKLELKALMEGDVEAWAEIMRKRGQLLSPDEEALESQFHMARMREPKINQTQRVESRDILADRGVVVKTDEPVTIHEKMIVLNKGGRSVPPSVGVKLSTMLRNNDFIVQVFKDDTVRRQVLTRDAQALAGDLDGVRTNLRLWILYTKGGKEIRYVLDGEDDIDLEQVTRGKTVGWRVVTSVV